MRSRATPSVASGAGRAAARGAGAAPRADGEVWWCSALHLGPGLGPVAVVGARDVRASVEAVGDRGGPVPDLVDVFGVGSVEGGAEVRVRGEVAGLGVG